MNPDENQTNTPESLFVKDVLDIAQSVYGHLSPMQHIISLSYCVSQIAEAIEIEALKIVNGQDVQDFMAEAAGQIGIKTTAPDRPHIEWDIAHQHIAPNCVTCGDELVVDQFHDGMAYGHCPECNLQHVITITQGE